MAHTDDCPCQTGPQSPENISQFWHIVKTIHGRQYYSPQRTFFSSGTYWRLPMPDRTTVLRAHMFYSSAPSSEKQECSKHGPAEQLCKNSCRTTQRTLILKTTTFTQTTGLTSWGKTMTECTRRKITRTPFVRQPDWCQHGLGSPALEIRNARFLLMVVVIWNWLR